MSCKAKKNKQKKFHLAFICCQIRPCLLPEAVILQQRYPHKKDFLITLMAIAITYVLKQDSLYFSGITLLSVLPSPGFFLPPSKAKPCLHCGVHFASRAARQHHSAAKARGPPTPLSCWGQMLPRSNFPLAARVLPRALGNVGPHHTHIPDFTGHRVPSPLSETPAEGQVRKGDAGSLFGVTPDLQHTTADLEISIGMALYSWLHLVQRDCLGGDKEQDLGLYYGAIILIMTSA